MAVFPGRRRIVKGFKWLAPGLRVKRWLLLVPIGLAPVVAGVALLIGIRITDIFDWLANWFADHHVDIADARFAVPVGSALILLGLLLILSALIAVMVILGLLSFCCVGASIFGNLSGE